MSFGQSRFWLLDQMLKDRTTFNMAICVRLEGAIRVEDMRSAVRAVVLRHEALRTRYFSTGEHGDTPMQGIAADAPAVPFVHKHIKSEAEAQADLDAVRAHVWDMGAWLGIAVHLLSMPSNRVHFLIIGCHHITLDGVSLNILYADLEKAYRSPNKSLPPLPPSAQYRAFARQQHADYAAGKMAADLAFYRALIPNPAAVKPLPLFPFARVRERVPLEAYGEVTATARVDAGLTARIRAAARAAGATTFHFYLATLHALIYRLLPDLADDVFIGVADANRTDAKFAGTLGFFLNLLPLRFSRGETAGAGFAECVKQARTKAYAALAHSRLPFDVLLDHGLPGLPRSAAHAPLFQVFVDYRTGVQERQRYMGVKASGESWYTARTGYDVALDIIENAAGDARVEFKLQDAFYGVEGAEVLVELYVHVLRQFAEEPGRGWGDVEVWPRARLERAVAVGRGMCGFHSHHANLQRRL